MTSIAVNNPVTIPQVGHGVFQIPPADTRLYAKRRRDRSPLSTTQMPAVSGGTGSGVA